MAVGAPQGREPFALLVWERAAHQFVLLETGAAVCRQVGARRQSWGLQRTEDPGPGGRETHRPPGSCSASPSELIRGLGLGCRLPIASPAPSWTAVSLVSSLQPLQTILHPASAHSLLLEAPHPGFFLSSPEGQRRSTSLRSCL